MSTRYQLYLLFSFFLLNVFAYSDTSSFNNNILQKNSLSDVFNYKNGTNIEPLNCNYSNKLKSTLIKGLYGASLGIVGTYLGSAIGGLGQQNTSGSVSEKISDGFNEDVTSIILGIIGYSFCIPAGVYIGGKQMDENGTYWGAFLGNIGGTFIGFIAGLGTTYLVNIASNNNNYSMGTLLTTTSICSISGSIIVYDSTRKCK